MTKKNKPEKEKVKKVKNKKDNLIFLLITILILTTIIFSIKLIKIHQTNLITESNKPLELYFCPRDNCEHQINKKLKNAKESINCAFFDLDLETTIEILNNKSEKIPTFLVLDRDNFFNQTKSIQVILDNKRQFTHNKFCIIDKKTVITGSFNPTINGNTKNNNNLLIIHSTLLAKNYEEEFKELKNKQFGKGEKTKTQKIILNNITIENYFCPDDLCQEKVSKHLKKAKYSIYFMTFILTDEKIANSMLMSNANNIQGIMESLLAKTRYSQYKRLTQFGINIFIDKNKAMMHHKVFIIDNKTIITGSYNPTKAGNTKNDENILIIHDKKIAKQFLDEFKRIKKK